MFEMHVPSRKQVSRPGRRGSAERRRRGRDPFCVAIDEEQAQQWRQTLLPAFQGESRVGYDWIPAS